MEHKRKCISCGEIKQRSELIKITKTSEKIILQPDSKTFGRSAYVCKNKECIEKAFVKNRLGKNLKTNIDKSLLSDLTKLS